MIADELSFFQAAVLYSVAADWFSPISSMDSVFCFQNIEVAD